MWPEPHTQLAYTFTPRRSRAMYRAYAEMRDTSLDYDAEKYHQMQSSVAHQPGKGAE
ncbi:hypothetical protein KSF_096230 [Reticulibacter mediterranei]|uniref:Uncharacterized protein n=1 Tax=Reticulibacter mediterranei TaxID=2778369 RepID=A0A8J3IW33_9CHLR|nr:hypothetical protein [Reticulibacter mediterranei]GHO99575.1 hypothetical protein KSF_096230 [Reticulibacter mediterranei]